MSPFVPLKEPSPTRETGRFSPPTVQEIAHAAALCWLNDRRHGTVAAALGINRRTLARWKRRPEFEAAYEAAALVWTTTFHQLRDEAHADARREVERLRAVYAAPRRRWR